VQDWYSYRPLLTLIGIKIMKFDTSRFLIVLAFESVFPVLFVTTSETELVLDKMPNKAVSPGRRGRAAFEVVRFLNIIGVIRVYWRPLRQVNRNVIPHQKIE
jgi:hypothetical protein